MSLAVGLVAVFFYGIIKMTEGFMKVEKIKDFTKIEWSKIDREKAKFIYDEAIARLDSIHKNNDGITNKAIGMLSFSLPVLTALTGFFVLQWGKLSVPLLAASVCSAVSLFAILVLLLLILLPRGLNSPQGGPEAYFKDDYYRNDMENIFKGNIQTLHQYIIEDCAVMYLRGNFLRIAIVLFSAFPVITVVVWAVVAICT
jgi:hypothetical protein